MMEPTHRFTRQTLCELVWSAPRTSLAKRLGISDFGRSKVCRRAAIPLPEPGYWAKRRAGKRTVCVPNRYSSGYGWLEKSMTMRLPPELAELMVPDYRAMCGPADQGWFGEFSPTAADFEKPDGQ